MTTTATSVASASIAALESHVTSLSSAYSSYLSIQQTATARIPVISISRAAAKASASLAIARGELLIATATDSSVITSATAQLAFAEEQLQSVIDASSLYGGLDPNLGFNLTMCVVFALLILFNLLGLFYRQWWFSIAFLAATFLEILGYIGRVISHGNVDALQPFLLQFICLTLAPVFTMGAIYYQLAKLSKIYGDQYSRWSPIIYSYIFITCDVISLVIQAIGGGMAGMAVAQYNSPDNGTHVFVAGLSLQVLSMSIFLLLWFDFLYSIYIRAQRDAHRAGVPIDELYNPEYTHIRSTRLFKYFTTALTVASIFVYIRCIYRVCELAEGWSGNLITHEKYFIALDAVMISAASVVFVPFFPGFVFDGRHTQIPIKKTNLRQRQEQQKEEL